mmetsp:Transcript_3291/g.4796  ORF Transcript_3291/g.4796 Transcript_3291/m.4796 type:complete len:117 (-) Transcript_3291:158-508(-)
MNKALQIVLLAVVLLQVGAVVNNTCCQCDCTTEATLDMPILVGPDVLAESGPFDFDCQKENLNLVNKTVSAGECVKICKTVSKLEPKKNDCESSASRMIPFFGAVGAVVVMSSLLL